MSDGMSDARASEDLWRGFWSAAGDLRDAAIAYARAVMRARVGHRGWGIARHSILNETNEVLLETGFALVDRDPEKEFEHYPKAYDRVPPWREQELRRELEERQRKIDALTAERAIVERELAEIHGDIAGVVRTREELDAATTDYVKALEDERNIQKASFEQAKAVADGFLGDIETLKGKLQRFRESMWPCHSCLNVYGQGSPLVRRATHSGPAKVLSCDEHWSGAVDEYVLPWAEFVRGP